MGYDLFWACVKNAAARNNSILAYNLVVVLARVAEACRGGRPECLVSRACAQPTGMERDSKQMAIQVDRQGSVLADSADAREVRPCGAPLAPLVLDAVRSLVLVCDLHGRILHLNKSCRRFVGLAEQDREERPVWELFAQEQDRERVKGMLSSLSRGEDPGSLELSCRSRDGSARRLDWAGERIPWPPGEEGEGPGCIVLTGIDLTERRRFEEALHDSEARTRAIVDTAVDAIVTIDEQGTIESANPAVERMFGYAPAELVGRSVSILMPSPYRDEHDGYLRNYLATGQRRIIGSGREVPARRKDGSVFPVDLAVSEVQLGRRRLFTGIVRDISERKRAEQEMTRLRLNQKSIIDSMPSILMGVDRNGGVTAWNRQAERATGVSAETAQGRPFTDFFPYLQDQLAQVQQAIARGQPVVTKRLGYPELGAQRYADVMVYPLRAGGGDGAVIRVDDVTARVRMDEMMIQSEKMLSIGGLAAGMAHEINTPLGVVIQSCQNARRRLSRDLPKNLRIAAGIGVDLEDVRRYLEARGVLRFIDHIQDSASRAAKIVADMLAFSRSGELHRVPTDLDALLDTSIRLAANDYELKKQYGFKDIRIARDYDAKLDRVYCDRAAIEQVILNLLKNAAQAMSGAAPPKRRRLTLRTRREAGYARIEVMDNGPGIDIATQRRVFEPFFSTKEVGAGTGLGLWVSYLIVTDQHKGFLSVESAPGHGASFIIRLPLRRAGRE
jgi:PAS domain S-box-containing protein